MAFKQLSLTVKSFHFDLVAKAETASQGIQVAMRQVTPNDEAKKAELANGNMFEVLVPFDLQPQGYGFKVSGEISLYVQMLDYFGEAQELPQEELAQVSKPAIDKIQALTYELTKAIGGQGVRVEFQAAK
ncbi:DUF1149 family protein [Lacticaseibacillus daqingensis]|uniref:DUF1149 family protein n=1 Tax=Lacticaseibacillus daqingensis TaxID=2486014 RepID=UPI0013DE3445|nr:DUF1149 family protein [Lacticaseibacillus daqingensis]